MAAQYCAFCGRPLPAEAQFCSGCGKPTGVVANSSPASTGPDPAVPPPPPQGVASGVSPLPPAGPPLGVVLGVEGKRSFLLQHQFGSVGINYRVLDREKHHLFTVHDDVRQELRANFLGGWGPQAIGVGPRPLAGATRTFTWVVLDATNTPRGRITIQVSGTIAGGTAVSTLTDAAGTPILAVTVQRGGLGGLRATAAFPDGRAMFEAKGNLIHHNFSMHDPLGAEVAKIHEAWASVRDTYSLDLVGNVDPLCPLIFAMLIDREKA